MAWVSLDSSTWLDSVMAWGNLAIHESVVFAKAHKTLPGSAIFPPASVIILRSSWLIRLVLSVAQVMISATPSGP